MAGATATTTLYSWLVVQAKTKRGVHKEVEKETTKNKKKIFKRKTRSKTHKKHKKKTTKETQPFSLSEPSNEQIKHAVVEQATIALSKGLQAIGVSCGEADTITASVVRLLNKAYEISETLTSELNAANERMSELEKISQKTESQKQELVQLQEKIKELEEKKENNKKTVLVVASNLSASIAQMGIGAKSGEAVTALLKQLKVPGAEYGVIAIQIAAEIVRGIEELKKESYLSTFKEYMKYFVGARESNVGGWAFGQDTTTGKMYVRLDRPCHTFPGYVHIHHRELVLKNTYPFKDVQKQFAQILAGEFELGVDQHTEHPPRSKFVNIFG